MGLLWGRIRPSGAPEGAKKIDFDIILDILNYEYNDDINNKVIATNANWNEADKYKEWVEKIIQKEGLQEHIEIIELKKTKKYSHYANKWESISNLNYQIVIKNLFFSVKHTRKIRHHDLFFKHIIFEHNTFYCSESNNCVNLFTYCGVKIKRNMFKNANALIGAPSAERNDFVGNQAGVAEIIENIFENTYLDIVDTIAEEYGNFVSNNWFLPGEHVARFVYAKNIEKFVNINFEGVGREIETHAYNQYCNLVQKMDNGSGTFDAKDLLEYTHYKSEKFTVNPDSIKLPIDKASIVVRDNQISELWVSITTPAFFKGINTIKEILCNDLKKNEHLYGKQNINWGRYQSLTHTKKNVQQHKDFFIALKEIAEKNSDKSQNFVLNREILKCDHYDISNAETSWTNWQDKFILWFGEKVSNHGISLIRPLFWLLVTNLTIAVIFYFTCMDDGAKFWHIFWEMFDPLSNLSESIGLAEEIKNGWVSFANVAQKATYAVLLYELIRVGRRFVAK